MNAIAPDDDFLTANENTPSATSVETYWGYIVRCQDCDRSLAIVLQWVSAFTGVTLLIAAFGFWTLPGSSVSADVIGFKLGISSVMAVVGMALVWFASHGTIYEVQIDLARNELREVLRNNRGTARVQKRVKFEDIDSIYIGRPKGSGDAEVKSQLIVRLDASSLLIVVANDFEENLTRLQTRMSRDILGPRAEKPAKANRGFQIAGAKGLISPQVAA